MMRRAPVGLGRLRDESGQAMVLVAAGMVAFMLMLGFIVDGGNLFQNKQSLQNAADNSAVAAALYVATNDTCSAGAADPLGDCAGVYAGLNNANGPKGTDSTSTALPGCNQPGKPGLTVTDTQPPSQAPGCYVYPYGPQNDEVEVWLTRRTSNFFGGLFGIKTSTESARAVASLTSGNPPPITFAALNNSCDNHTLLIKAGGILTVNQAIYVNSCNVPQDAFDVFGGGSIRAPSINVVGGWETHDNSTVWSTATGQTWPQITQCLASTTNPNSSSYYNNKTKTFQNPPPPGCPIDGVTQLQDPFANFPPAPALGPGNIGAPVNITKISRGTNGRAVNIADVVTSGADGFAVGDSVTISGVGVGFNGAYTVQATPASNEFTFDNSAGSDGCGKAPCPNLPTITGTQLTNGVATVTTSTPSTLANNNTVTVTGLASFFNATNAIVTGTTVTPATTFSYAPTTPFSMNVMNKQVSGTTATLTVNSIAGLAVGDTVNVSLNPADALIPNGSYVLTGTGPPGNTISFKVPGGTTKLNVTKKAIATTTKATLTVPNNNLTAGGGDQITVNTGDPRFDGTFTSTAATGGANGTVAYTIPAVQASIAKTAASTGTVTLTTSTDPTKSFENGDTVAVSGLLAYAGSFTVANINAAAKTFTYSLAGPPAAMFQDTSWTKTGNVITVTTASAHGLHAGDTITVMGAPGGGMCMPAGPGGTFTASSPTTTTFAYTVPAGCNPGASGNQAYNFQLVGAASSSASGTVTLTTLPTTNTTPSPCVNCITVPASEAQTASGGTAVLTGAPFASASGSFTPAWMPVSSGVAAKNLPGSPALPSPDEISTGTVTLQPGTYYGGICIGAAAGSNCVNSGPNATCTAVGGTTTTLQSYSPEVDLAADVPDNSDATGGNTTIQVTHTGISVGDLIAIDDEEMTVTSVTGTAIGVSREANGTEDGPHTAGTQIFQVVTKKNAKAYSPAVTVNAPGGITAAQTTVPVQWGGQPTTDPVQVNDVIQIGNEQMLVTSETAAAMSKATLTVTRTSGVAHANNAPVLQVSSGSAAAAASVTLSPGVYIMAGGGFSVCGAASVNAPQGVMIYNTNDPTAPTGNGALGQIDINTAGNVHLAPMTTGTYAGLTIFQDRSLTLVPGTACDAKSNNSSQWDIALQSAAPLPVSGELGSISGTIYDPSLRADFGDSMSGTANLAVISSCIYINGANSTFNFNPGNGGLFGVSATLSG